MADVTITGLPNASALTGAERVPMDQAGTTVDAAASAIAALATKATVGLANVDNTSDANKPISAATQAGLDGKAAAGPIGSSGLTMAAGVLGRESGTGGPVVLNLSGLSIVNGVLTVTAAGSGTVTSVGFSVPTGFSVTGSPITTSGTLALSFAAGYGLPTTAKQTEWDTAHSERLRWDGGSAGLNAATGRTSLGLGTAAQAAAGDFALAAQGVTNGNSHNHDGGDGAQIAYGSLSGLPTIPALSSSAPQPLGATAAAGSSNDAARIDHVHQRDADVIVIPVGDESTALTAGTNKVRFRMPFAATLLAVRSGVNLAPTGSTLIVDVNEAGVSVLGTKLSIDATETSSTTAASAATITDSGLADDSEISIDIDQIGSTVAGAGLKVYLFVRRT